MVNKYHSDTGEKIETLLYSPGLQDSGDLETGTRVITAVSKPLTADYSRILTLPKPADARLEITMIAARLQVTRDSGASGNLYCTVSVDSPNGSANLLFNGADFQAIPLQAARIDSGALFNLLSDGQSHTFYFFFWVNAGNAVISLVQLWEGVGSNNNNIYNGNCLKINHSGLIQPAVNFNLLGSGTPGAVLWRPDLGNIRMGVSQYAMSNLMLVKDSISLSLTATVDSGLCYISESYFILSSES